MKYGGFIEESKWEMYQKTPKHLMPLTVYIPCGMSASEVNDIIENENLSFPLILKPDAGMRGLGIVKLNKFEDLKSLSLNPSLNYVLQEYIDTAIEIGLFAMCRKGKWEISSLMQRGFLEISGNGVDSLEELIRANDRAFLQLERLRQENTLDLTEVLNKGATKRLESLGNHRLGTMFINVEERINPVLSESISKLCESLSGFQYGRLDIKIQSWEDFEKLQNFWIIEVNGANSEPAHIYDPSYSIFKAWSSLLYHFNILAHLASERSSESFSSVSLREFRNLYIKHKALK